MKRGNKSKINALKSIIIALLILNIVVVCSLENQNVIRHSWSELKAGQTAVFSVSNKNFAITKYYTNLQMDLTTSQAVLKRFEEPPPSTTTLLGTYQYFELLTTFTTDFITVQTVEFRVTKDWLTQNNFEAKQIKFFEFNIGWQELDIVSIGADQLYWYYKTTINNQGYFAIGTNQEPITVQESIDNQEIVDQNTQESKDQSQQDIVVSDVEVANQTSNISEFNILKTSFVALAIILSISLAVLLYSKRTIIIINPVAERLFSKVEKEQYLNLKDGVTIKSVFELVKALKTIGDDTFEAHVNRKGNDFRNWVRQTFENDVLAGKMSNNRYEMINVIEQTINNYKKENIVMLDSFIDEELASKVPDIKIKKELLSAGWDQSVIDAELEKEKNRS
ncbi:PGF-pre-PGF domain-containing protein [Candidatus Woesearchaeota archaeon]|nr:PGF-pre-PGF domain-containing protein [Candidatus Woesearchaeota archaeon]